MRRYEDEKMWRWEDVRMRRCEDVKMWRWDTDPNYWKNPALKRSREKTTWRKSVAQAKAVTKVFGWTVQEKWRCVVLQLFTKHAALVALRPLQGDLKGNESMVCSTNMFESSMQDTCCHSSSSLARGYRIFWSLTRLTETPKKNIWASADSMLPAACLERLKKAVPGKLTPELCIYHVYRLQISTYDQKVPAQWKRAKRHLPCWKRWNRPV